MPTSPTRELPEGRRSPSGLAYLLFTQSLCCVTVSESRPLSMLWAWLRGAVQRGCKETRDHVRVVGGAQLSSRDPTTLCSGIKRKSM